ncbi:MAG: hypothetical protein WDO24_18180 [Pseudomonadota bacterium]
MDIFRLERDWSSDNLVLSAAALRDQVSALHDRGYHKLVLAGQSYGAWISLLVAASGPPIHAVIATAPAAFGRYPDSRIFRRNADELYPILDQVRNTRVMLFLFEGDAYDPGDRATPARAILEQNGRRQCRDRLSARLERSRRRQLERLRDSIRPLHHPLHRSETAGRRRALRSRSGDPRRAQSRAPRRRDARSCRVGGAARRLVVRRLRQRPRGAARARCGA